jgi:hypothetical protein
MKSLAWGIQNVIPDNALAAWGARAILSQGYVDLLGDRMASLPEVPMEESEDKTALYTWMEEKAMPQIRKDAESIPGNDDMVYPIDDVRFHARYGAQRSYGYLYITTWMDPS